jgi:hypothetical protein
MGLVALLLVIAAGLPARAAAQGDSPLRIGQDYALAADESTRDVVVIFGNADISGHAAGDVVVILGNARLSSTASIDGSLIVVGGAGVAASDTTVRGDVVVIGGGLDAPGGFKPQGESIIIGSTALGGRLNAFAPWITRGLLWGRLIVPGLGWIWGLVGIFFVVYLTVNLVFDRPVRACADTLADRPLTAFAVGLLVLLLARCARCSRYPSLASSSCHSSSARSSWLASSAKSARRDGSERASCAVSPGWTKASCGR